MRIRILWEGKTKDSHLRAIQQDLAARIEHFTPVERGRTSRPSGERATPARQD